MEALLNYQEAVTYIENIPRFEIAEPLAHAKELLRRVDEPQNSFKVIHVAGTNGKGSVCAYLDAMFQAGGFKCGLFTSPHLVRMNERFKINGEEMSDDDFMRIFNIVKAVIDDFVSEGKEHPSYFEIVFVMGALYFREQAVDITILETGLGGRLDATNTVTKPLACVITSIGLDHTEYLGDTLAKIAYEKAGIIKPKIPVIFAQTNEEVRQVITKRAVELGAPMYCLEDSMYKIIRKTSDGIDFSFYCKYYSSTTISINSIASYQVANASLALYTMGVLKDFTQIPLASLCQGIKKAKWEGRMETVLPGVILDGAHNEDGILNFAETAAEFSAKYRIVILFTAVSDKKYQAMIRLIMTKLQPDAVVTTQIAGERIVKADKLAESFVAAGCQTVYSNNSVANAFEQALKLKGDGLLFCVGSLYMIGEIKSIQRKGELFKEDYR